jgi:hypothetical protein
MEHLSSNIGALAMDLSSDDMHEIEQAYPFDHGFPHTFLSGTHFMGEEAESKQAADPAHVMLTQNGGATFDWVQGNEPIRPKEITESR